MMEPTSVAARKRIVTGGVILLVIGLLVAICCVPVLSRIENPASWVFGVHQLAVVTMLLGLVLILVGYRVEAIYDWTTRIREQKKKGRGEVAGGLFYVMLPLLVLFVVASQFMPSTIVTLACILFMVVMPGVVTTVIVYSVGVKRAFCIGAVFPLSLAMAIVGIQTALQPSIALENTGSVLMPLVTSVGLAAITGTASVFTFAVLRRAQERKAEK